MNNRIPNLTPSIRATLRALDIDPDAPRYSILHALSTTPAGNPRKILGKSMKTDKGRGRSIRTAILYMAPAAMAGVVMCPWASAGCAAACLGHSSGRLRFSQQQKVLAAKALWFHLFRHDFVARLREEIDAHTRRSLRAGDVPAVRLNGSTDIMWELQFDMTAHPDVQFYDYTKAPLSSRVARQIPANYHLTFSVSEKRGSMDDARAYLDAGHGAAVVVQTTDGTTVEHAKRAAAALIEAGTWHGYPTIDGDRDDARFMDPPGSWVVLYAKGIKAPRDMSGFVQRVAA